METESAAQQPYFSLARQLDQQQLAEADLPQYAQRLLPPDNKLLDALAAKAAKMAFTHPRSGWAITAVAAAAAQQIEDPFLNALAAWYLACAANAWYRPQRVVEATARARAGFAAINEPGWVAACDWQLYAHPWMHNNFSQAVTMLEGALAGLRLHGFVTWAPYCHLSLAYAHLLKWEFEQAYIQTQQGEQIFQQQQNMLGIGYCHYTTAGILRRQMRFKEAHSAIQRSMELFAAVNAEIEWEKGRYSLAYIYVLQHQNLDEAESLLQQVIHQFTRYDLPLWSAQAFGALADLHHSEGNIAAAAACLHEAETRLADYPLWGLRADNANMQGLLALLTGHYTTALQQFRQAETHYHQLHAPHLAAVTLMNQGEALGIQGFYQQAVQYLEGALAYFQTHEDDGRAAACRLRLANVWVQLGRPQQALAHLEAAAQYAHPLQQADWLSTIYNRQARIYLQLDQPAQAAQQAQNTLNLAAHHAYLQVYQAAAHYLFGLAQMQQAHYAEAVASLQQALSLYSALKMNILSAYCFFSLGMAYAAQADETAAFTAWTAALDLNDERAPALTWQIQAELAQLHTRQRNLTDALQHYQRALTALGQVRRAFWQPELADAYLEKPDQMLDQAIHLAWTLAETTPILSFMEAGKAHTVLQRLCTSQQRLEVMPAAIQTMVTRIQWLQGKQREQAATHKLAAWSATALNEELETAVKEYTTAVSQWERSQQETPYSLQAFDLAQFRQQAAAALGDNWLALDYYLGPDWVACAVVTPTTQDVFVQALSASTAQALRLVTQGNTPRAWSQQNLALLGRWLLPPVIHALNRPDLTLIIVPHRQLHRIPWAGLRVGQAARPLVAAAAITLIPSLHSLTHLWQRVQDVQPRAGGLLVAVSEFNGRHPRLTAVAREATALAQQPGAPTTLLLDEAATTGHLAELGPLARFSFLHLASHVLPDTRTGRLSQLALSDRDLWLDELQQLAPLPQLVTLSACSGLRSRLYRGDEPLGFPVACLAAGAQRVIGSLRPVKDEYSPEFMWEFYAQLQQGQSAARALAQAQRSAWQKNTDLAHWASFQCIGLP